jgi:hypothetical protein
MVYRCEMERVLTRQNHMRCSCVVHVLCFLLLQAGIIITFGYGNIITSVARENIRNSLIIMKYNVYNPQIYITHGADDGRDTYMINVDVTFYSTEDKKDVVCYKQLYDYCIDAKECISYYKDILEKITKSNNSYSVFGWYHPNQETACEGVYLNIDTIAPNINLLLIVIWLCISLIIVIVWLVCCRLGCILIPSITLRNPMAPPHIGPNRVIVARRNRGGGGGDDGGGGGGGVNGASQLNILPYSTQRVVIERIEKIPGDPDDESELCRITLEEIPIGHLYTRCISCKKVFQYQAMMRWMMGHTDCPNCRAMVSRDSLVCYQNGEFSSEPECV